MRSFSIRLTLLASFLSIPLVFLSGCATPALRGTPYYHTEPSTAPAATMERIPLWPFVFYQSPTLELLWPFFEKSDDFAAFRPFFSVYGLNQPDRIYSLLWPLGLFDGKENSYRFFPFFWGEDYTVGFPLYWHYRHPFGPQGGLDALIPLWWLYGDSQGYSRNLLWPIMNVKDRAGERGWRVWPLAGCYSGRNGDYYRFAAWPLAHQWGTGTPHEESETVIPLYMRRTAPDNSLFLSLPYSRRRAPDRQWDLVPPLFYRNHTATESTILTPLYSQGEDTADHSAWQLLLPLLYHRRDDAGSTLLTPLYYKGENTTEHSAWQLLLPLYYSSRHADRKLLVTLLGGISRDTNSTTWVAAPLISGGWRTRDSRSTWFLGPLAHFGKTPGASSKHIFPLFYSRTNPGGHLFLSLPWSSGSATHGTEWQLVPPIMLRMSDGQDRRLLTPLYSEGTRHGGTETWQTLLPLWYRSHSTNESMLATLLGGWETAADGHTWLIWPLLSGGHRTGDARDMWILAPLFHTRWDKSGVSSHLLPLYWWDSADDTLLSPFLSTWQNPKTGSRTTLVPPALTLYSTEPKRKDLWTLAGMAHFSWGEEAGSSHVLPLFYRDPSTETFLSIPWSSWSRSGTSTNTLIAPLLSWMTTQPERSDLWTVGPLAHFSWGEEPGPSHVFPLFYRNPSRGTFLSVPWSSWSWSGTSTNTLIAPLLSWMTTQPDRSDLWAVGPLAHFSWGESPGSSHVFPLFYRDTTHDTFISLPYSHWGQGDAQYDLYPLLLTLFSQEGNRTRLDTLAGLLSEQWGDNERKGYFLPFYYHYKNEKFYTLLFGWNRSASDGFVYPLTPLLGVRTGQHSGGWLFPLWSRNHDLETQRTTGTFLWGSYSMDEKESASSLFPLYSYRNSGSTPTTIRPDSAGGSYGKTFWSLPFIWYQNTLELATDYSPNGERTGKMNRYANHKHGCFPLWSYSDQRTTTTGDETHASFLLFLYDYERTAKAGATETSAMAEHVRRRLLWRVYHYERTNGNVSTDIFPAITYDSTTEGFRRWSFLWRLFRYERGPDGRKLDLLFVPLLRPAPPAPQKTSS